jgi:hypothetical protein
MIAVAILALELLLPVPRSAPAALGLSPENEATTRLASQWLALQTPRVRRHLMISRASVPVLSTTEACGVTRSSAVSGGNVAADGGAPVTSRGVCWSTNPTPTIADDRTTDGTGSGSFASLITGLSAGTTYTARAYATNFTGIGYGSAVTFTTATGYAGQPPPGLTPELFAPELVSTEGNQSGLVVHPGPQWCRP